MKCALHKSPMRCMSLGVCHEVHAFRYVYFEMCHVRRAWAFHALKNAQERMRNSHSVLECRQYVTTVLLRRHGI